MGDRVVREKIVKAKKTIRKKTRKIIFSSQRWGKNIFKSLLFWLTRPLARVIIFTGSLKSFMFRKLKTARENKQVLMNFGGENLVLTTSDNRQIDAMYFDASEIHPELGKFTTATRPTLIFCLGNSSLYENSIAMIRFYLNQDVNVMVFNYGGYGQSQGSPSVFNTYRDVDAAFTHVTKVRNTPNKRIIVHGFSIGGGPATYLASKYPIDLVLDRTYAKIGSVVGGILGWFTDYLYPYDNVRKIKYIKGNIHIVEAANDEIMSSHHVNDLFNEIIRVRHPDAHGSEIDLLRAQYVTVVPSTHTDCWLTDIKGIYGDEHQLFKIKVLATHSNQTSQSPGFFKKVWKKITS
jgi:hypothetical protein